MRFFALLVVLAGPVLFALGCGFLVNLIQMRALLDHLEKNVFDTKQYWDRSFTRLSAPIELWRTVERLVDKRLDGLPELIYYYKNELSTCERESKHEPPKRKDEPPPTSEVNFASQQLGASIHKVLAVPVAEPSLVQRLFGEFSCANQPELMLNDNMVPGNCFAFKYNTSEVTIRLSHEIFIVRIVLGHTATRLSTERHVNSAPKNFAAYAGAETQGFFLGNFVFDHNNDEQNFMVNCAFKTQYLRLHFQSNHGHPNHTCVYRVAVLGRMQ